MSTSVTQPLRQSEDDKLSPTAETNTIEAAPKGSAIEAGENVATPRPSTSEKRLPSLPTLQMPPSPSLPTIPLPPVPLSTIPLPTIPLPSVPLPSLPPPPPPPPPPPTRNSSLRSSGPTLPPVLDLPLIADLGLNDHPELPVVGLSSSELRIGARKLTPRTPLPPLPCVKAAVPAAMGETPIPGRNSEVAADSVGEEVGDAGVVEITADDGTESAVETGAGSDVESGTSAVVKSRASSDAESSTKPELESSAESEMESSAKREVSRAQQETGEKGAEEMRDAEEIKAEMGRLRAEIAALQRELDPALASR